MRLYVNTKEVPYLKEALSCAITRCTSSTEAARLSALLKRVELCEELQKSERKAQREETLNEA